LAYYAKYDWQKEKENLVALANQGNTLEFIGGIYGVTRERIRQIFKQYGITSGQAVKRKQREASHYTRRGDQTQDYYSTKRQKFATKKANAKKLGIPFTIQFGEIEWPTHCPVLGIEIDYFANGRQENSPSLDRINSNLGYVKGNVAVISWRANRIKNDGSLEEHVKIVSWMSNQ
jgi:hypothetical protein